MIRTNRSILAHAEDVHCIIFHVLVLLAYGCAFWLYLHPEVANIDGPWSRAAFVGAATIMLGWVSGIDVGVNFHNHTHRKIFRSAWQNRWFGRVWTFAGGWPSFFWWHAHVVVHHANLLGQTDWTLPRRRPDGAFESIYRYSLLHWPWRYMVALWRDFTANRGGPDVGRRALREFAIFLALWSIPFWIDPSMGLFLWALPHWFGNLAIMAPGMYAQHARCVEKSPDKPFNHSNSYLSRFSNLTMFNIGYHIEHHDFPGVHWSQLPNLHERLKVKLIESKARVLPFGYYRASRLLSPKWRRRRREAASAEFEAGHPDYVGTRRLAAVPGGEASGRRVTDHGTAP